MADALGHLEAAAGEHSGHPAGVWNAGIGKSLALLRDVIFHAADDGIGHLIKIGGAPVAVVRQTDAARVDDGHSVHAPNVRAMDVPIDRNRLPSGA